MNAFFDARCIKCGKRFGWEGNLTDRPPCPKCGDVVDPKELAEVEKKMAEARRKALED